MEGLGLLTSLVRVSLPGFCWNLFVTFIEPVTQIPPKIIYIYIVKINS